MQLALAVVGAGVVYAWRRSNTDEPIQEPITERHATAFLVRRKIDPDRVGAVTDHVADVLLGAPPDRLLGIDGASTASLFLDRTDDHPKLCWYVEVPRSIVDGWDDPDSTVDEAFPLTHEALTPATESIDRSVLVHAVNPSRPRSVFTGDPNQASRSPATTTQMDTPSSHISERVVGSETCAVDVDLVTLRLRPGSAERVADWFASVSGRVVAGDLDLDRLTAWSVEMLDAEEMYTESIVLERRVDGYRLVGYMEARDMETVYDAYYDTWNPVARASEFLFGRILETPAHILEYPLDTDAEMLAHAIDPDRPRRVDDTTQN